MSKKITWYQLIKKNSFINKYNLLFVLLVSIIIATVVWSLSKTYFEERTQALFEIRVNTNIVQIEKRIMTYEQVLRSGVAFFQGSGHVSSEEWHRFIQTLEIDKNYPGMQGMGFSLMIAPSDIRRVEQDMRMNGYPSFTIKPKGKRDQYSAILYLEPHDPRNLKALGYDMYSNTKRQEAMMRARDTGAPCASGPVKLLQEIDTDIQPGILLYLPLYKTGNKTDTIKEKRQSLVGFIYSPFRMRNLLNTIVLKDDAVDFEVYDGDKKFKKNYLYSTFEHKSYVSKYQARRTLLVGGRKWDIYFYSTPEFDTSTDNKYPLLFTFFGVFFYLILFMIIASLIQSQKIVHIKTSQLERNQLWLNSLLKAATDGIHLLDSDGNLIEYSISFIDALGYSHEEAQNLTIFDFEAQLSKQDIIDMMASVTAYPIAYETRLRCKNGTVFDVEITTRELILDGKRFLYASSRDITDRKNVEKTLHENKVFYETVFSSVHEAILILDNNKIVDCNDMAVQLFELTKENLIGINVLDTVWKIECDDAVFGSHLDAACLGKPVLARCSLVIEGVNKKIKNIEIVLSEFGKNEGKLIWIARDITQQLEEEKLFRMQTRQAQMGEMVSMIAHQWRQPLAIINAITAQLRIQEAMKEESDMLLSEKLMKIEQQSNHLSQTISDYRDFFRPDKPKEFLTLSSILNDSLDLIDYALKSNGIKVTKLILNDLNIFTYRNEVLQVLIALLKNSMDAFIENNIHDGNITLTVDQDDKYGIITILDNAGGINDEVMSRLFTPYFTTKNNGLGTGLGLYMSKTIIEEHCEGILTVFSEGVDTIFTIKLPL
ncbi:MAG: CHASE domain-containing protein [Sulfuricurvum sp.]|nr:CHASE domain-containing protein [Sulfuricurvum sp.]